jgi:hypothetical protein
MINVLRVVISAIIGYWIYKELALEGFVLFLFFFGIFIAVSILLEIIRKVIENIKNKGK